MRNAAIHVVLAAILCAGCDSGTSVPGKPGQQPQATVDYGEGEKPLLPLNQAEFSWTEEQLTIAREIVETYTGKPSDSPSIADLDLVADAYRADPAKTPLDRQAVTIAFAIAFGNQLVDELAMEWAIAGDKWIVIAVDKDTMGFPIDFAAARLTNPEAMTFSAAFAEMKAKLEATSE